MSIDRNHAPIPDLRIVPTGNLHAHEDHDSQRSLPLIDRLEHEEIMINPTIVAPMGDDHYVILDGANRCHAFQHLNYPHILVQVTSYDSGLVDLQTWCHIIGKWDIEIFLDHLAQLSNIEMANGQDAHAIAHILLKDERVIALHAPVENTHERNSALRDVVRIYQQNARLNRTTITEPEEIWPLYPDSIAVVVFQRYEPHDIIAAARYKAYLPAGVSRHIVYGRALRVNYPIAKLRDQNTHLDVKNQELRAWLERKLTNRQVRFYAESTYQFDE
jgi:L-serine kinase (ATP) / ParB family transcriptional regulator, heme-responsive regulator